MNKPKIDVDELLSEMEKVPFGNSGFQNMFFTDGQEAPQRRRRHILLQLSKKVQALKACEFRRQRFEIDLEELDEKLGKAREGTWEHRRLKIDRAEKEWGLKSEIHLINDALVEVNTYKAMLEELPPLKDRVEFELAELGYWEKRLTGDLRREMIEKQTVGVGTQKALEQIGIDVRVDPKTKQLVTINKRMEEINGILRERQALAGGQEDSQPKELPKR